MKKLMIASALVAFCGAVMAADGLESQNVVGYLGHNVANGVKAMRGQLFQVPGGGSYNLQSLVPYKNNGADICEGGEFNIWWWNTDTSWGDKTRGNKYAVWSEYYVADDPADVENENYDDGYVYETAWTTRDDDPVKYRGDFDKTFAAGEGFFVQPFCSNPKLTIAGEVLGVADTTSEYRKVAYVNGQKQLAISPFPVAVALQDIVPMKNSGTDVCEGGEFNLWWWNTDTSWGDKTRGNKYAVWSEYYVADDPADVENENYDDGYVYETAWTTRDDDPIKYRGDFDKTFAAGEGFYIQPFCANPMLAFPNPFYKAAE